MNLKVSENNRAEKRFKIFGVEFFYLGLLGIATAFIGWLAENTAKIFLSGYIDSRFHILPFISPYALVVFALHIALGNPDNLAFFGKRVFKKESRKNKILSNVISYLAICFFVFFGELVVGNLWEILFGVELWNYSNLPLSVTQYTGVVSTLGFGTGAYLLFKFVYAPALSFVRRKVSYRVAKWIVIILGSLIVLDTLRLIFYMMFTGEAPIYWKIVIRGK